MTDIVVKNVDVPMLREQRDTLVDAIAAMPYRKGSEAESLNGIVNLLDAMLDSAEDFDD